MRSLYVAIYFVLSILSTAIFFPKYFLLGLFKGKYAQYIYATQVVKWLARRLLNSSGSTFEVIGQENVPKNETVLIVGNHQGYYDIPVLTEHIQLPFGFISKKELSRIPILSRWMKYFKCVFIDRENPKKSLKAIEESINNINNGYSQVIFPEGTRSKCSKMGSFKPGSLKIAIKTGATILPVTINGTYKMLEETGKIKKAHVKLVIHKPIRIQELDIDLKKDLASYVENIIKNGLDENSNDTQMAG